MNSKMKVNSPPPLDPNRRSSRAQSPAVLRGNKIGSPPSHIILTKKESKCQLKNTCNQGMLDLLKAENTNLKEQNEYLLNKLRLCSNSEGYYKQKYQKYSDLVSQLKGHNERMEQEIKNLKKLATKQINKLSSHPINQLFRVKSANDLGKSQEPTDSLFNIQEMNPEWSKDDASTEALSDKCPKEEVASIRKFVEGFNELKLRKKRTH